MIRRSQAAGRPTLEGRTVRPGATFRNRMTRCRWRCRPQAPRFKAGDRPLPGVDWELVELLGVGGFGEVWKARNPHFGSVAPVALKFCLDPAAKQRLLKHEAAVSRTRSMLQGRHDGIVPLLHTYLSADPPCLAYEYVAGGDLAGLILDTAGKGGMPPDLAARLIQRLASIVGFAHGLNPPVVHRDLKPANILAHGDPGEPALRITDFGIGGLAVQQARDASHSPTPRGVLFTNARPRLLHASLCLAAADARRGAAPKRRRVRAGGDLAPAFDRRCDEGLPDRPQLAEAIDESGDAFADGGAVYIDCFGDESATSGRRTPRCWPNAWPKRRSRMPPLVRRF